MFTEMVMSIVEFLCGLASFSTWVLVACIAYHIWRYLYVPKNLRYFEVSDFEALDAIVIKITVVAIIATFIFWICYGAALSAL